MGLVSADAPALEQVASKSGWRALYRGNAVNVLRSAPQKALDFFAFDGFKRLLGVGAVPGQEDKQSPLPIFLAAGLAGATSNALLYPLEVVRSRLTCDTIGRYTVRKLMSLHLCCCVSAVLQLGSEAPMRPRQPHEGVRGIAAHMFMLNCT